MRHNREFKNWVEDYHNLCFQMSLYSCVVKGGASLSTENADLASTSWSFFGFTPVMHVTQCQQYEFTAKIMMKLHGTRFSQ